MIAYSVVTAQPPFGNLKPKLYVRRNLNINYLLAEGKFDVATHIYCIAHNYVAEI